MLFCAAIRPSGSSGSSRTWGPAGAVAVVSTIALAFTAPGQTLLLSLLNVPLREAFGMDSLTLNAAYTVATITASLPLVWIGRLTDRFGPRRMMILVALCFGAACLFTATVANVAMVFVAFFLLRCFGQGSLSLVSGHALAMWFHRRLGRVEGLRTVAVFGVWALAPALTQAMIDAWGWRATWASFGVAVAVTLSALAWRFLRDRPEDVGLTLDGAIAGHEPAPAAEPEWSLRDALRTRAYRLLVVAAAIQPMIGTAVLFDVQPLLVSRGIDASASAAIVGVWSGTMAIFAIPAGHLVDRTRPGRLLAIGLSAMSASVVLLLVVASVPTAIAAMALMALGQSLLSPTLAATAARFFGRRHHGAIRSSLGRVGIIAAGLGPLVFGASRFATGAYDAALIAFALTCLPAALASLRLVAPESSQAGDP